jgi:hypothetical protein
MDAFFVYRRATSRQQDAPSEGPDWLILFEEEV